MNIKAFLVDALGGALELGIGTPEDVLRHLTPDVLAAHLPRPLWARLLTACLGASRVDAALVVDTIGVPNLCEHMPAPLIWACIADVGLRSLGNQPAVTSTPLRRPAPKSSVLAPPPEPAVAPAPVATGSTPVAIGPSIPPAPQPAANQPLADLITELEQDSGLAEPKVRPRSPTAARFRQSNTAIGRGTLGSAARRPQASASPALGRPSRRSGTEVEDPETAVENADWRQREIAVDDSQLVEWQADGAGGASSGSNAITGDDDFT
ncbi:MAG TPA: hypothetical protein VLB44_16870, partial [Kofleriaceae bacterium]|nr:hypothetical protein [Kofleriaceae bacterium]